MKETVTSRSVALASPAVGDEEWHAVRRPLSSGWLIQGPEVAAFEQSFARRHRVEHALATTSCTTALHVALAALGIGPGDEVIVPSFTWVASANAVLYCGATPVLCDVDPMTFNIDPADAASRVTARTRAVIAVHLFGRCVDMVALRAALPPHLKIVEDAACAAGSAFGETPAGGLGDVGCFSFHPRKSITTGEGGMVTTRDRAIAAKVEVLRNHGAALPVPGSSGGSQPHVMADFDDLGFNYRMTEMQAAIGRVQLEKLDAFIDERDRGARLYHEALGDVEWLRLPAPDENGRHAWQSFVTMVDPARAPASRNDIMARLHAGGVATRPGTHAVHMLGYYAQRFGSRPDDLPGARDCEQNTMAIPLHNRMTADDFAHVIARIRAIGS